MSRVWAGRKDGSKDHAGSRPKRRTFRCRRYPLAPRQTDIYRQQADPFKEANGGNSQGSSRETGHLQGLRSTGPERRWTSVSAANPGQPAGRKGDLTQQFGPCFIAVDRYGCKCQQGRNPPIHRVGVRHRGRSRPAIAVQADRTDGSGRPVTRPGTMTRGCDESPWSVGRSRARASRRARVLSWARGRGRRRS